MQCLSRNTVPSRARHLTAPAHQSTLPAPVRSRQSTVRQTVCLATTPPSTGSQPVKQEPEDDFEGLLPEEDFEVPGSYFDALTSSTKLGKAVKSAVEELEHLGNLEAEVLSECDDLLKQLGIKGSLFGPGDNPLAKLQQELAELEKLEQQELEKQQQQQQQQGS